MTGTNRITCLSMTKDQSLIAGGSWQRVWLWQLKPDYRLINFDGHTSWVVCVCLSADGYYLMSASQDNTVRLWDVKKQQVLWTITDHQGCVNAVLISPDGKLGISGSDDKSIKIWNIQDKKLKQTLNAHTKAVTCLAMSFDGKLLFSGSSDKSIKIWDLEKGQLLQSLTEHNSEITSLATNFVDQKLTIVSGSSAGEIKIWEINKNIAQKNNLLNRFISNFFQPNTKLIRSHSESPHFIQVISHCNDQKEFISHNSNNQVKLWAYDKLKKIVVEDTQINDILFDSTSNNLFCATNEWLKLIILSTGQILPLPDVKTLTLNDQENNQPIEIRQSRQFYLLATTLSGYQFRIDNNYLNWTATGGKINDQGLFVADIKPDTFLVTVKDKFGWLQLTLPIVLVLPPPHLERLTFSRSKKILESNQQFCFEVQGLDQYDKPFNCPEIRWIASYGKIDSSGNFISDKVIDQVQIQAKARDVKNNRDVVIEEFIEIIESPKLVQLLISPKKSVLYPGDSKKFSVDGLDQRERPIKIGTIVWTIENINEFYLQEFGDQKTRTLTIPTDFKGVIKLIANAIDFDIKDFVEINIPAVVKKLEIEPHGPLSLYPNQEKQFIIKAFDQCGEPISTIGLKWHSSDSSIDDNGLFIGNYQHRKVAITATLDDVTDSLVVELLPVLYRLEIYPQITEIEPHKSHQFNVKGYDQFNNQFSLDTIVWQSVHNKINDNGYFISGDKEVDDTITVYADGISQSIFIQVREISYLKQLNITPSNVTLEPNQSQDFYVIAKDQRDQEIILDRVVWSAEIGYLEQSDNYAVYQSFNNQKGIDPVCVTAWYKNTNKNTQATVLIPPVLRSIKILKQEVNLFPEEKYQFEIVGLDQSGDFIDITNVQWKCSKGGSINALGLFQGGYRKREVIVTAIVGGFSATAKVILKSVPKKLIIDPDRVCLEPEKSQEFTVQGFDQYGSMIQVNNIFWDATGGKITQSGVFTADRYAKGNFSVIAIAVGSPLLSKKYRKIFFVVGVSTRLGSWIISYERLIRDLFAHILQASKTNQSNLLSEDGTLYSDAIADYTQEQSSEIINIQPDDPLQIFVSNQLRKFVSRCLYKISEFSLQLAYADVSATAKVEVIPVLRNITLKPTYQEIQEGEKPQLTVSSLDQSNDILSIIELDEKNISEWLDKGQLQVIGGILKADGTLFTDNSTCEVLIKIIIEDVEISAKILVKKKLKPELEISKPRTFKLKPEVPKPRTVQPQPTSKPEFKPESEVGTYSISTDYYESWFYRSQLFYDGYSEDDISDYSDYLEYQDICSYMQRSE